jgi:(4S)-4-hydroxy-5-phosphonooxypentane-2,3-dione isomerase
MIVLAVTWIANAGREAEAARLFQELAVESRKEPGCVLFTPHQHKAEPARFLIYEQFKDDAALDAHRAAPHFQKYVKQELVNVAVRVEGNQYNEL